MTVMENAISLESIENKYEDQPIHNVITSFNTHYPTHCDKTHYYYLLLLNCEVKTLRGKLCLGGERGWCMVYSFSVGCNPLNIYCHLQKVPNTSLTDRNTCTQYVTRVGGEKNTDIDIY